MFLIEYKICKNVGLELENFSLKKEDDVLTMF